MTITNRLLQGLALCGLALFISWSPAQAQSSQKSTTAKAAQQVKVPARWLTMAEVESMFGAPTNKSQPVGNPPITSWEYPNFYVYFEGDKVLDAFAK